jgi:hypothetical protein
MSEWTRKVQSSGEGAEVPIGANTPSHILGHGMGPDTAKLQMPFWLELLMNSSIHQICTLAPPRATYLCCWHVCKPAQCSFVVYSAQAVSSLRAVETLHNVFAGIPHAICTSFFAFSGGGKDMPVVAALRTGACRPVFALFRGPTTSKNARLSGCVHRCTMCSIVASRHVLLALSVLQRKPWWSWIAVLDAGLPLRLAHAERLRTHDERLMTHHVLPHSLLIVHIFPSPAQCQTQQEQHFPPKVTLCGCYVYSTWLPAWKGA